MKNNTFAKGNPPNKTSFKKGECVGEKSHSWGGGIQKAGADCTYLWAGANVRLRRPRVVYEKHFGVIPKGFIIAHKDKNKDNDAPENLEAISRAENMRRNAPHHS